MNDQIGGAIVIFIFFGGWIAVAMMIVWLCHKIKSLMQDPLERAYKAPSAPAKYDYPRSPREETL